MNLDKLNANLDMKEWEKLNKNFDKLEGSYRKVLTDSSDSKTISQQANNKSESAIDVANGAVETANNVQNQFDRVVADGDSSVEVVQARGDFVNLRVRMDTEKVQVSAQLAQIALNVRDFGAVGDGVVDDTLAIQEAINQAPIGSTVLLGNLHKITSALVIEKPIKLLGNASIFQYYAEEGTALRLGKEDAYISITNQSGLYPIFENFRIENMVGLAVNDEVNSVGFEMINIIQGIFNNVTVTNFRKGLNLKAINNRGTSQNTFNNLRLIGNLIGVDMDITNGGWVTENTWYKGQIVATSNDSTHNDKSIMVNIVTDSEYKPDHNIFNDVNFENRWSDKVIYCDGAYNSFVNCRWESTKNGSIVFTTNSYNNSIILGFGNGGIATSRINDISKKNMFITASGSSKFTGASSYGLVTGNNDTPAANGGRAEYPVFYAMHKATPNALSIAMGSMGLHAFRPARQDYPSIKIDPVNGRLFITNGYYEPTACAYFQSSNTSVIQLMHDSTNPVFMVGDETNKGLVNLSNYYIWVDSNGKLRINYGTKPTSLDTQGTIIVPKASTQANSTATDITTLKNDFNALLNKLKSAGLMEG